MAGIARRDLAMGLFEHGFRLGQPLHITVGPHAIVAHEDCSVGRKGRHDLVVQPTFLLRLGQAVMAFHRIGIRRLAVDAEVVGQHLGGLTHVQRGDRVGQPVLQPDHRFEEIRAQTGHCLGLCERPLGLAHLAEPFDGFLPQRQRRVTEGLGAPRQDHLVAAIADVAIGGVNALHARAAVDLHGKRHHFRTQSQPQRRNAGRVHLVGDDIDAAENHQVQGAGIEPLSQQ